MDSTMNAGAVLVSPLAVDDVFRQQAVPEVQELLRQLQLQQANDAEELRTLIGVRYLSFLEGLPEISRMQRTAEEALEEAKKFGLGLRRLATAITDGDSSHARQPKEPQLQHDQQQQLLVARVPPLQHSTPLDDFLFARGMDSSPLVFSSSLHQIGKGSAVVSPACSRLLPPLQEREGELRQQPDALRYLQQQLLLLPSRVWEAVRCHQFVEALRLILVEGSHQAEAAKAAVQRLQKEQHQLQEQQHQHHSIRQLAGCWALAQQMARAFSSLVSSVRALALRHLASTDLTLPIAADAAAAAALIYILDSRRAVQDASDVQDDLIAAAAKWLLGVFFSARGEALDSQGVLSEKEDGTAATAVAAVTSSAAHKAGDMQLAVDAAERLVVAFSASLEAAAFLFSPLPADAALETPSSGVVGGPAAVAEPESRFAVAHAAEMAFGSVAASDSPDLSWALRALPKVFALIAAQSCSNSGSSNNGSCSCCENNELCPRRRLAAFVGQWRVILEAKLCRLPAEGSQRSLRDIRAFWLALMERLQARVSQGGLLPKGTSLFVVDGMTDSHSRDASACKSDLRGVCGTAPLLRALGESCARACVSISERRVKALPLLTLLKGDGEVSGTLTAPAVKRKYGQEAFEEDLGIILADAAFLFGAPEEAEEMRAGLRLRAAIAAYLLQSLAQCTAPLATDAAAAAAAAATTTDEPKADGALLKDHDTDVALITKARRVEWLFVVCSDGHAASDVRLDARVVAGRAQDVCVWRQEDSPTAGCQRQLRAFLAEWTTTAAQSHGMGTDSVEQEKHQQQQVSCSDEAEAVAADMDAETVHMLSTARAAARSLPASLCLSSLVGYAVGLWPFVKVAVRDLQASWRWHWKTSVGQHPEHGWPAIDISGGAMTLLVELSRRITVTSRDLQLEDLCTAPLLCFALKAVAAEEVAAVAVAEFGEAVGHEHQQYGKSALSHIQSHLLQLLVDIELLAAALDAPPPLTPAQELPEIPEALPMPLRKAVDAGLGGRRSAEALRDVARQGRLWLQPSLVGKLERRLESGFAASNSLILPLLPSDDPRGGAISGAMAAGEGSGNTPQPLLLAPRERLSLLPVTPLPAFASVLCSSSSCARPEAPAQQATINNGDAQEEEQQQPKEQPKQLHRIRLDDAVDSVSRGLQSWLKRGSSDAEGVGIFPLMTGGGSASSAGKGATAVAAAGSGLAEAWVKQVGHVSALIGQHVESVQSRAAQTGVLHLGQRNGNVSASYSPASPATTATEHWPT